MDIILGIIFIPIFLLSVSFVADDFSGYSDTIAVVMETVTKLVMAVILLLSTTQFKDVTHTLVI